MRDRNRVFITTWSVLRIESSKITFYSPPAENTFLSLGVLYNKVACILKHYRYCPLAPFFIQQLLASQQAQVCVWNAFCARNFFGIFLPSLFIQNETRYVRRNENHAIPHGLQPYSTASSALIKATLDETFLNPARICLLYLFEATCCCTILHAFFLTGKISLTILLLSVGANLDINRVDAKHISHVRYSFHWGLVPLTAVEVEYKEPFKLSFQKR